MTDLADGVVYSRSGLTYQAGLLEKRGLISRSPSPDDERSIDVTITDAGRALFARVLARPHRRRQPPALRASLTQGRPGADRPAHAGARSHAGDTAPVGAPRRRKDTPVGGTDS